MKPYKTLRGKIANAWAATYSGGVGECDERGQWVIRLYAYSQEERDTLESKLKMLVY